MDQNSGIQNDERLHKYVQTTVSERGVDHKGKLILIPPPSEFAEDPLNWPAWQKRVYLAIVCFSVFAASTAPIAHQTAIFAIAKTYGTSPTQLTYTVSAAIAGLLGGPLLLFPLVKIAGRTAVIFWSFVIVMATQIWSATSTGPNDYISFTVARLFSGIFASLPSVSASGYVMDIFFLHERGFAFASYTLSLLLGIVGSSTIGGFIVDAQPWPVVFWWTLIPLGIATLLFALVVEDTEYAPGRCPPTMEPPCPPNSYVARRVRLLSGWRTTPPISRARFLHHVTAPFIIAISPVAMVSGFFSMIYFAWTILCATELPIFLQKPLSQGGYDFSPLQTAAFTFTAWISIFLAQLFGTLYNDRMPLWIANRRRGSDRGRWHPEDRLWSMLIGPAIFSPIGLGIFGAALKYHLHYMVLSLGFFLIFFSGVSCVPVCINYVVENFTDLSIEATEVMNAYRLSLGLSMSFYYLPWQKAVGVGWLFGMAAFFSLFAMGVMALLALKGRTLRRKILLVKTEDGEKITAI